MSFIGIDLGGTNIRGGIVDELGNITNRRQEPTFAKEGANSIINRLIDFIKSLIEQDRTINLEGIGVGCPGIIDIEKGIIHLSPNLPGFKDIPLKKILQDTFSVSSYLENDANVIAFGEKCYGEGKDVSSLICITLGTGVGGGIILDNKLWHGFNGMASEIGHITIIPDGIKCGCGNNGCLEAYASATAVINRTIDLIKKGHDSKISKIIKSGTTLTAKMIYEAALDNDLLSSQILDQTGKYLGIGIADLINILNPEMIVIGGGMASAWDMFFPSMSIEIKKRAFDIPAQSVKIVRAKLGDDAGILGAAALIAYATEQ